MNKKDISKINKDLAKLKVVAEIEHPDIIKIEFVSKRYINSKNYAEILEKIRKIMEKYNYKQV
jgi:hypothetical protein